MNKEEFITNFVEDQKVYRELNSYYCTIREPNGKVFFTNGQLLDIKNRFSCGESMTSIGKSYGCSRQTIRENLKKMGVL